MPLPVFLIEFYEAHKRYPEPKEITLEQRRSLLNCARMTERLQGERERETSELLRRLVGLRVEEPGSAKAG